MCLLQEAFSLFDADSDGAPHNATLDRRIPKFLVFKRLCVYRLESQHDRCVHYRSMIAVSTNT